MLEINLWELDYQQHSNLIHYLESNGLDTDEVFHVFYLKYSDTY